MTVQRAAPTRRAKGQAKQQAVVDAAIAVIGERGLADVRMSDIAERAGMSTGHVTYYFPSKTALLMLAIQHSEESLHREVVDEVLRIADPWLRLYRLLELSVSTGRADQGWVLWFEVWANAGVDDDLARVQAQLDSRWRHTLAEVIRYGCEQGAFVTDDPVAVSTLLSCLVDGLSVHLTLADQDLDPATVRDLYVRAAQSHLAPGDLTDER